MSVDFASVNVVIKESYYYYYYIVKYRDSAVNCAKTGEPIKMQFGMPSQVGPGNMYYIGCRCSHKKGHFCARSCLWGS